MPADRYAAVSPAASRQAHSPSEPRTAARSVPISSYIPLWQKVRCAVHDHSGLHSGLSVCAFRISEPHHIRGLCCFNGILRRSIFNLIDDSVKYACFSLLSRKPMLPDNSMAFRPAHPLTHSESWGE